MIRMRRFRYFPKLGRVVVIYYILPGNIWWPVDKRDWESYGEL